MPVSLAEIISRANNLRTLRRVDVFSCWKGRQHALLVPCNEPGQVSASDKHAKRSQVLHTSARSSDMVSKRYSMYWVYISYQKSSPRKYAMFPILVVVVAPADTVVQVGEHLYLAALAVLFVFAISFGFAQFSFAIFILPHALFCRLGDGA